MKPRLWFCREWWYCGRPGEKDSVNFGVSATAAGAWRKWFEFTRYKAAQLIIDAELTPPARLWNCSALGRHCAGIIAHDRYLIKIDGGKP
ncbi:hypothetical protein CS371_17770 (plasmid) [Serratia marcescens]|nr:hypothetical protein CS371_17770 [Serratia marcescens]